MKNILLASILCICCAYGLNAQKVYSTDSKYDADVLVFVADSKYDADLLIYFSDSKYDAKWSKTSKKQLMY